MTDDPKSARSGRHGGRQSKPSKQKKADTTRTQLRRLSSNVNRFGFALFRQVAKAREASECLQFAVAPSSLFVVLSAFSQMSSEEENMQVVRALFTTLPANVDDLAKEMTICAQSNSCYKWRFSSMVCISTKRSLNVECAEKLRTMFGMQVRSVDTTVNGGQEARDFINGVVRLDTRSQVRKMIADDTKITKKKPDRLLVTCAVYFHPWWQFRFNRRNTVDANFFETDGRTCRVRMMRRLGNYSYAEFQLTPEVKAHMVGLQCRKEKGVVYFLLPEERFGLRQLVSALKCATMHPLTEHLEKKMVRLSLPKFVLSDTLPLRDDLLQMGAKAWFDSKNPCLSEIVQKHKQSIGHFFHHVTMRVNEDGEEPEDDEDSSRKIQEEAEEDDDIVEFKCDQPFVVIFRQNDSKSFWLMAAVSRPTYPNKTVEMRPKSRPETDPESRK